MGMTLRLFILTGLVAAGLSAPAVAGEPRWIDPWAPDELAGGGSAGGAAYHPWAGEGDIAGDPADLTGSIDTSGFTGGAGARQTIIVVSNGFYFNPSLPAGQAAMTGGRARPVHPLGHRRF